MPSRLRAVLSTCSWTPSQRSPLLRRIGPGVMGYRHWTSLLAARRDWLTHGLPLWESSVWGLPTKRLGDLLWQISRMILRLINRVPVSSSYRALRRWSPRHPREVLAGHGPWDVSVKRSLHGAFEHRGIRFRHRFLERRFFFGVQKLVINVNGSENNLSFFVVRHSLGVLLWDHRSSQVIHIFISLLPHLSLTCLLYVIVLVRGRI